MDQALQAKVEWGRGPVHFLVGISHRAYKASARCRHHIPDQKRKLTNWPAYEASLRQRGDVTVWFTDAAITARRAERRTSRGGQRWYSPLAILTALTLRAVFRLALRQTEGLIKSILRLLGPNGPGARALVNSTSRTSWFSRNHT